MQIETFNKNNSLMLKSTLKDARAAVFPCPNNSFISANLEFFPAPTLKFNMRGFALDSTVDSTIKDVPVFLFVLQRRESSQTYVSCFYGQDYPELFEKLNKKSFMFKDSIFFFNWFDHESIMPRHPEYRDDISNLFYYTENKFLDYRVFNATNSETLRGKKVLYSSYFELRAFPRPRFIRRNRFYKRKFDWILKNYA